MKKKKKPLCFENLTLDKKKKLIFKMYGDERDCYTTFKDCNLVASLRKFVTKPGYAPRNSPSLSVQNCPTSSGAVLLSKLVDGRSQFKPPVAFVNLRSFLRNSRKYGLRSLRKTPTEGIPFIGLGPFLRQSTLSPTPPHHTLTV